MVARYQVRHHAKKEQTEGGPENAGDNYPASYGRSNSSRECLIDECAGRRSPKSGRENADEVAERKEVAATKVRQAASQTRANGTDPNGGPATKGVRTPSTRDQSQKARDGTTRNHDGHKFRIDMKDPLAVHKCESVRRSGNYANHEGTQARMKRGRRNSWATDPSLLTRSDVRSNRCVSSILRTKG